MRERDETLHLRCQLWARVRLHRISYRFELEVPAQWYFGVALEEESAKLQRLVAELSLNKTMLQDILAKIPESSHKRELVDYLMC